MDKGNKVKRIKRCKATEPLTNHKVGGQTTYNPETTPKLFFRLSLLGLTNMEMAATLQISIHTFEQWLMDNPLLLQKVREGKKIADAQVAHSLYKRATGFTVPDTLISVNTNREGKAVVTKVERLHYYPPDTAAAIFWLKNRTRDNDVPFTDTLDVNLSKEEKIVLDMVNTDLSDFTEDELATLNKYMIKAVKVKNDTNHS